MSQFDIGRFMEGVTVTHEEQDRLLGARVVSSRAVVTLPRDELVSRVAGLVPGLPLRSVGQVLQALEASGVAAFVHTEERGEI